MPEIEEKVKDKDEERREKPLKKSRNFLNKVVIRKLPPNLNAESFIEIISPLPDYYELYFCPADWSLGAEATSRAYIEFKKEEDIFIFKDKFDGYVFVDSTRGSEYPAIVEYAAFQGLPKSRARKKDKNAATIESEPHFLNFLEMLKKEEEEEQKNEPRPEYSYQVKDDKKITSTPLIEFLSAKNQEKRDAKRKKADEKKKQRDEDKHKKKILVAKNIPEPVKEEVVYEDGVVVRTVPSRLGRGANDRKKDSKPEGKQDKEPLEKDLERREKREKDKERDARRKQQKEEKRKAEREQRGLQKAKDHEPKPREYETKSKDHEQSKESEPRPRNRDQKFKEKDQKKPSTDGEKLHGRDSNKDAPAKSEPKRYSALRKARQEKATESVETTDAQPTAETSEAGSKLEEVQAKLRTCEEIEEEQAKKEARIKRQQELKEKRAREADERAQRQIKNKDRPSRQIYQPKRRSDDSKTDNLKSSDENSEASRLKSDSDRRSERRDRRPERKTSRKNSRDETRKERKARLSINSDDGPVGKVADVEVVAEKLEKLDLDKQNDTKEEVLKSPENKEIVNVAANDDQE